MQIFQSDGGGEFISVPFKEPLQTHDIHHQFSCPYTPSQNGRAKRKHRHVIETGLTMLFPANLHAKYWLDAFCTVVYIITHMPSPLLDHKCPFELLYGANPDYGMFRPFGCRVFPCLCDYTTHKLEPQSKPCIFIGYNVNYKGFHCLDPTTGRIYITRHTQFDELYFPYDGSSQPKRHLDFSTFTDPSSTCTVNKTPGSTSTKVSKKSDMYTNPCSLCPDSTHYAPSSRSGGFFYSITGCFLGLSLR